MDPPSSPPNNFRRTWGEDRTKDRYKDWPWHSSSSLHLCYMRDWHLESAFVYSSLWLNAKYIGVSAQSSQPNTDGNLFNLESESGRNEKKTMQKTELLAHSWLLFPCVCVCVAQFYAGSTLTFEFSQLKKSLSSHQCGPCGRSGLTRKELRSPCCQGRDADTSADLGRWWWRRRFLIPYNWWKGLLYTGVYQKTVETRYKHFRRKSQDLLTHPYHLFVENLDAAQKLLGPMPPAMVAIVFQSPSVL